MKTSIRGRTFRIERSRLRGKYGFCDNPTGYHPRIRLDPKAFKHGLILDTLIHEMLHAAFWDMGEAAIDETATDIAETLIRLGVTADPKKVRETLG